MSNHNKEENYKKEIRKKITLPTKSPTRSSKNKEYNYIPPERFYTEKAEQLYYESLSGASCEQAS